MDFEHDMVLLEDLVVLCVLLESVGKGVFTFVSGRYDDSVVPCSTVSHMNLPRLCKNVCNLVQTSSNSLEHFFPSDIYALCNMTVNTQIPPSGQSLNTSREYTTDVY